MEVKKENRWGKGNRGATKGRRKPTARSDSLQFLPAGVSTQIFGFSDSS